jgi:trans-aconitate methyltransferase
MCGSNSRPIPQDFIQKYAAGKTFADIGCMWGINGALSFSAERSGAKRVTAVDIYPATDEFKDAHSRCNSRINFVHGDINETETLKAVGKSEVVFCAGVLYHTPDPFSLLVRLRSICDETLILGTQIIPEIPGLRNTAIFYPMLDEARRKLFNIRIGMQKSVTGPYEPESGYGNWFWGMTSSCVESLLVCAGFAVLEKYLEPFHGWFICRVAERKFAWVSGEYITREDPRFTQYL